MEPLEDRHVEAHEDNPYLVQKPHIAKRYWKIALPIVVVLLIAASTSFYFLHQQAFQQSIQNTSDSPSPTSSMPENSNTTISPTSTNQYVISSPTQLIPSKTPTPVPTARTITISGLTYEDTNNNKTYDNEPSLGYMTFNYYDSTQPQTAYAFYANQDGTFSVTLNNVSGNLVIVPKGHLNYVPQTGTLTFSTSTSNVKIGYIGQGASSNQGSGTITGTVFNDTNGNNNMDSGESGRYFYKLYLSDSQDNSYLTSEGAEATNQDGYFSYHNLAFGTYTITLSNPNISIPQTKYTVTLSAQNASADIKIPIR